MSAVSDDMALIRRYHDLFNERRLHDAAALVASDCTFVHVPTRGRATGPAGYLLLASQWLEAAPDAHTTVLSITLLDEGRYYVVLRGSGRRVRTSAPKVVARGKGDGAAFEFTAVQDVWIRDGQLALATLTYDTVALVRAVRP
jgi:hypothetical protein